MAKNSITDYDNIAANNTDVQSVDVSEGCSPSGINNAIREVMADLADVNDGTVTLTSPSVASLTLTGNANFGDNDKAQFGAGNDLQIYHDGSNSYIQDAGTGNLIVKATDLRIRANNDHNFIVAAQGGGVDIYNNNQIKLTTTSTGVDVTGNVTVDSEGGSATVDLRQGSAKTWGFLEWSGGLSAEGSLNVSSVSDDGNGDFGVNFTSSMADAHYAYNTLSSLTAGNTYVYGWELVKATGSANLQCGRHYNGGPTVAEDPQTNELSVHGDLA